MVEKGELKVGDTVRYWARTPTSSKDLDGFVGTVYQIGSNAEYVYVDWLPILKGPYGSNKMGPYGANVANLVKIDLLP